MKRFASVTMTAGLLIVAACGSQNGESATSRTGTMSSRPESSHTSTSAVVDASRAGSKHIVLDGVRLTIPAAWPVIDGAHATYSCSSTFEGQANRALIGVSYQAAPSCPAPSPGAVPPPADGVWMQPMSSAPPNAKAITLPKGQVVHLIIDPRAAAVTVWYHHVMIQIGVGTKPAVERGILDSITFDQSAADTAVPGRCPPPDPTPPTMPTPTRLTTPLTVGYDDATLRPEPAGVRPTISAATAWANLFHNFGAAGFAGALHWSITFGSYSAQTPAKIHSDGSETPLYRSVPTWLIRGVGVNTAYGHCGITVYAPYNATTGRGMGVETIG